MKVRLNENKEMVDMVKEGLKARGGYCPCRREMTEDTKCMCKEFREQIADPEFEDIATACCIIRKNDRVIEAGKVQE